MSHLEGGTNIMWSLFNLKSNKEGRWPTMYKVIISIFFPNHVREQNALESGMTEVQHSK